MTIDARLAVLPVPRQWLLRELNTLAIGPRLSLSPTEVARTSRGSTAMSPLKAVRQRIGSIAV
jgi:hypothetical protein